MKDVLLALINLIVMTAEQIVLIGMILTCIVLATIGIWDLTLHRPFPDVVVRVGVVGGLLSCVKLAASLAHDQLEVRRGRRAEERDDVDSTD